MSVKGSVLPNDISESQKMCLRLVGKGMTSKEIAIQTGLSPRTVDQYVNQAAASLGAPNRREAARKLESLENQELNKFQLQSEAVASAEKHGIFEDMERDGDGNHRDARPPHFLPPLGGRRHDLNAAETIQQIIKVAIFAAVGFGSIVAAGAWLQGLFS